MGLTYFKRYRMEIDLTSSRLTIPELPAGYTACAWNESLLNAHAQVKYLAFCEEIDSFVFPSLSDVDGCRRLMREISSRSDFIPEATWLLRYQRAPGDRIELCGTIQGLRTGDGRGAVQNVGVVPEHRGRGLGTFLLAKSMAGFLSADVRRVSLEVTARNRGAQRLYRQVGFRRIRTVYKTAEVAYA